MREIPAQRGTEISDHLSKVLDLIDEDLQEAQAEGDANAILSTKNLRRRTELLQGHVIGRTEEK